VVNRKNKSEGPSEQQKSNGKPLPDFDKIAAQYPLMPKAPQPIDKPNFTIGDIKNAIPKHCFERSLITSFGHLIHDLVLISLLVYAATYIGHPALPSWTKYILWPAYWYMQGCIFTGIWIIAHECGHGAFSDYKLLNDTVGWTLHSALLVPFFSWKISHRNHHSNTGSSDHDEAFVPFRKNTHSAKEMMEESPLYSLFLIFAILTLGWLPGYLIKNMGGPPKYWQAKARSHFNPNSVLYEPKDYWLIVLSDIGMILTLALCGWGIYAFGFSAFVLYYFVPYLIVHAHLVCFTYLHHTDVYMPHFDEKEWSWLRGAMSTIDRSWGPFFDYFFHHITDTHVAHHLFSYMPFYHAVEATQHIKKVMGKYYMSDHTPVY